MGAPAEDFAAGGALLGGAPAARPAPQVAKKPRAGGGGKAGEHAGGGRAGGGKAGGGRAPRSGHAGAVGRKGSAGARAGASPDSPQEKSKKRKKGAAAGTSRGRRGEGDTGKRARRFGPKSQQHNRIVKESYKVRSARANAPPSR